MKGFWSHFISPLLAFLLPISVFSLRAEGDSIAAPIVEPIPPIYMADTLSIHQTDNAPLFIERTVRNNSATIFGSPHLLVVSDFSDRPIEKEEGSEWFFVVVFGALFLMFIPLLYFPYYSRQFFRSVMDVIQFRKIKKEEYFENKTPKWLLSANYLVVVSLLVVLTLDSPHTLAFFSELPFIARFGLVFVAASLLYFIKRGIEKFLSWVFDQKNVLEKHLEVTVFFNNLSGIILVPFMVIYYYNPEIFGLEILWILLLSFVFLKIARRSLVWLSQTNLSLFHIILYLCTVELAPFLVVFKVASATMNF